MSILTKKRTSKDYEEKLASLGMNTRENVQAVVNNFKKFVQEKHQSTPNQICVELIEIRKTKGDEDYEFTFIDTEEVLAKKCCELNINFENEKDYEICNKLKIHYNRYKKITNKD